MGILHSFFDESGKFQDHQIVAFCGFGASPSQLKDFDQQWESQLRRTGLEALHWVKARRYGKRLSRKIGPQSLKERMNELKPFADCINDHLGIGIVTAFEVKGYTSFAPESKKLLGGSDNPFYVQFLRTILILLEFAKAEESITITCDEDEETAWNCYQLYRRVKVLDSLARRRLGAVTFANDVHFPALQAADMLSFLCREHARARFYKTPYEYYEFFKYLTQPRGSSSIEWRVAIKNKRALKSLDNRLRVVHAPRETAKYVVTKPSESEKFDIVVRRLLLFRMKSIRNRDRLHRSANNVPRDSRCSCQDSRSTVLLLEDFSVRGSQRSPRIKMYQN